MKPSNPAVAIDLLRRAALLLEDGPEAYICHALYEAIDGGLDDEIAYSELCRYIEQHIRDNAVDTPEDLRSNVTLERCTPDHIRRSRAWDDIRPRLAWIDRMICQLEQDGTLP